MTADYLTRLQARRTAINAACVAADPYAVVVACRECAHTVVRQRSYVVMPQTCSSCGARHGFAKAADVLADLDRAISWAKGAGVTG